MWVSKQAAELRMMTRRPAMRTGLKADDAVRNSGCYLETGGGRINAVRTTAIDPGRDSPIDTRSISRSTYAVIHVGCVSTATWAEAQSWQCDASTGVSG